MNSPTERRGAPRIRLQVPMFVRGRDAYGNQFLDLGKTLDISALGAFLASPRSLHIDEIISLTIPAPASPDSALVPPATPPIRARVRRQPDTGVANLVGVEFLTPLS